MAGKRKLMTMARGSGAVQWPDLRRRRRWFDDDADVVPEEPPGKKQETTGSGGVSDSESITLPKSAFDARLERARSAAARSVLSDLGFDSLEAARAALGERDKATGDLDALKGEVQTLQDKLAAQEKAAQDAAAREMGLRRETAIREAAKRAGARDAADFVNLIDAESVLGEDGEIDAGKLDAAVQAIRKQKEYLFQSGPGSPSNAGGASRPDPDKVFGKKPTVRF